MVSSSPSSSRRGKLSASYTSPSSATFTTSASLRSSASGIRSSAYRRSPSPSARRHRSRRAAARQVGDSEGEDDSMDVHPSSTPMTGRYSNRSARSLLTPGDKLNDDDRMHEEGVKYTPPTVARASGPISSNGENLLVHRTNEWYHDAIAQCHDQLASLNDQARILRESLQETSRQSLVRSSVSSSLSNTDSASVEKESMSNKLYPEMLSPSDTINFVNTVLRRSYNGTGSMDDDDDDDDYLQEFSMDEIDEIGQNGDDQSNSFRYMTMEVPNTILRNQSQTLLSSIDKSP